MSDRLPDTVEMKRREIIPLYKLLIQHEDELDKQLLSLLDRLEKQLYTILSIEEMEKLQSE